MKIKTTTIILTSIFTAILLTGITELSYGNQDEKIKIGKWINLENHNSQHRVNGLCNDEIKQNQTGSFIKYFTCDEYEKRLNKLQERENEEHNKLRELTENKTECNVMVKPDLITYNQNCNNTTERIIITSNAELEILKGTEYDNDYNKIKKSLKNNGIILGEYEITKLLEDNLQQPTKWIYKFDKIIDNVKIETTHNTIVDDSRNPIISNNTNPIDDTIDNSIEINNSQIKGGYFVGAKVTNNKINGLDPNSNKICGDKLCAEIVKNTTENKNPIEIITKLDDAEIPKWVKGIAGFWVEDKITDTEFIEAIEFLINQNIIKVIDPRIIELEKENSELRQKVKLLESEKIQHEIKDIIPQQETKDSITDCSIIPHDN